MLLIIAEELTSDYEKHKSKTKPKIYAKQNIRCGRKKYDNSTAFYREYFGGNPELLVNCIKKYKQLKGSHKNDEGCISVEDEYIESLLKELSVIPCYWHSLQQEERGLAYYGITIIPPRSLKDFISVIDSKTQFNELKDLLRKADNENKFVIHFGI